MNIVQGIEQISITLIPMLLGIICHEVAHGYVAYKLGDSTAYLAGRLTLNPVPHIDPAGAMVFIFTSLLTPFALGWAKPVPIEPRFFRNIRRDILLVALAGPMANIALAIVFTIVLKLTLIFIAYSGTMTTSMVFVTRVLSTGVFINLILAFFNLLPIPPMDGSKIVASLLPPRLAYTYESYERFGFFIIMGLLFLGVFSYVLLPLVRGTSGILFSLFGIA